MHSSKDKTNALRILEAHGIPYQLFTFSPEIHSAIEVAQALGLPPHEVYKTLVVLRPQGRPLLVMIAGDRELDLKRVAAAVGEKRLRMATQREAEALTGLQVGGISALALLGRPFDVFIDCSALALQHIVVSAGRRGMNVRLAMDDLLRVTRAHVIEATATG
ncbi:MAG: aminoacyl-tRNA deacylase [Anaerolineae bacterium]